MQGKATFRGHPLHLMTISFPVGFWTGTLVTDFIGWRSGDPFWYHMSVALIAMGTITGFIASIFGYIDYRTIAMSARAKKIATWHMWGSLLLLVVFPLAYFARAIDYGSPRGIGLTLLGAVILLVAGYWGSELAVRFGLGFPERLAE